MTLADEICDCIKRTGGATSFVELCNHVEALRGDFSYFVNTTDCKNVVLWVALSEEGCATLHRLIMENKIHFRPTSVLVYMIDGGMIQLPIAKTVRCYKKPHWLPVTWHLGEYKESARSRAG